MAEIVQNEIPDAELTLSSDIGRVGLIERENATIMNASLVELSKRVVGSFRAALKDLNIQAPFFVSQNDGTLMSAEYVERYPVLTFASGPTNSMRGAARLSGQENAVVVDIGGTTTDVGVLVHGFPRESAVSVDIGGVRTNFRMPDILSIGLGGGSLVRDEGPLTVGPDSVGYELTEKALVFGGETLTATDIAVAAGAVEIGDRSRVQHLSGAEIDRALAEIHRLVEDAVDRVKTSVDDAPVVLVGGGSVLITRELRGASEVKIPDKSSVANAIGAGMAQVGGEIDRIFSYDSEGRDASLARAKEEAVARAVAAGATAQSVQILEIEELPLTYMPAGAVRLRVKAVGDLAMSDGGGGS
jgi:N-methylhydantoinase A/oxoprolinase/acetone carboxylase beta subunit